MQIYLFLFFFIYTLQSIFIELFTIFIYLFDLGNREKQKKNWIKSKEKQIKI